MVNFAPLNIISGYSFLQSGLTMDKVALGVKSNDYFGLGLADNGVLFGVPEFIKTAESLQKPYAIGIRLSIEGYSLCLYLQNEAGYRNLIKINNESQKTPISLEQLKSFNEGVIGILETKYNDAKALFDNIEDQSNRVKLNKIASVFKTFYLGIEVTSKEDVSYANSIRKFAHEHSYDCIAFPRIKYLKKNDAIIIDIVNAISNDDVLENKEASGQEYFMNEASYKKIYTQKELLNTVSFFKNIEFDFHIKRGALLKCSDDSKALLKEKCEEKLKSLNLNDEKHNQRLDYELSIINEMGYPDYFLLVEDYVNYAKNHGILVGAGRGSSAGSLVAYLLNITEVDPLDYDLLFERFLNPFRKTMPDIDVDFMDIARDDIIQYMREKYGHDRVANIVAFQTFQAKQSIRDIGRVYQYKPSHIDLLCKRLTNDKLTLKESYKQLEEFRSLVDSDKYYLEIVSLASKLEGLPRQKGLHASAIIVNNESLDSVLPISYEINDNHVSQYSMNYLEEQGLLKMDFLGLRNLTTVYYCLKLIKKNRGIDIKFEDIPYKAKESTDLLSKGYTMGIFQLESAGMNRAIKILQPSSFNDVVALLALFRPGPMDSLKSFADREHGKEKISYYVDSLEPVLKYTFGIITYQEQISQIAQVMAGFSMAEADMFRRAVSKKKKEEMESLRNSFIEGSLKNGYSQKIANEIYDLIYKFADYGFNKSHSVVYSILACRMAYLKALYPLEFYASILETNSSTNDSKFALYVAEMKNRGYKMLPPNINESTKSFTIKENGLLFPLNGIKSVNELIANNILEERKNGPFKDFFNFVIRMFKYKLTENQINNLIDSGAMDIFSNSRESLRASIKLGTQYAKLITNDDGQMLIEGISLYEYPKIIEQYDDPITNLNKEFEAIGIMLSNSPLHYKKDLLMANNVNNINEVEINENCTICGIIKDIKTHITKNKKTMAFLKVFDETSEIEVTVFGDVYQKSLDALGKNKIILIKGRLDNKNDETSFIADEIRLLEEEEADA